MSLTVTALLAWRPEDLHAAANDFDAANRILGSAVGDLTSAATSLGGDWEGKAADAAITALRSHATAANQLAEAVGLVRGSMVGAADAIGAARALLARAQEDAASHGLHVAEDGAVRVAASYIMPTAATPVQVAAAQQRHHTLTVAAAQAQAMARQALAAASEADADAASALRAVWIATADGSGSDAADLAMVTAITDRPIPTGLTPAEVAGWWASLSTGAQALLVSTNPGRIGNLDGVPVASRDIANRAVLATAIADTNANIDALDTRIEVARRSATDRGAQMAMADLIRERDELHPQLAMLEAIRARLGGDPPAALMLLDTTAPGHAAIAIGDVDTADHVAVLVPGMNTYVTSSLSGFVATARRLEAASLDAKQSDETVATVAWLGYTAPGLAEVGFSGTAEAAAPTLSNALWGIEATHGVNGADVHLSLLGHSYGSYVSGLTAAQDNPIDDLVLFGSPGAGVDSAAQLAVPTGHVFVAAAASDYVAVLGRFGTSPATAAFGAIDLQTDGGFHPLAGDDATRGSTGHSEYYKADSESLWNLTAVVTGKSQAITQVPVPVYNAEQAAAYRLYPGQ